MGITGRTPQECYKAFREHVARVMAATLTHEPLAVDAQGGRVTLAFATRKPVPLDTRAHGTIFFGFSQALRTEKTGRREHYLRTTGYWYRLQNEPGAKAKALIRWEYESADPRQARPARHHAQFAVMAAALDLNRLHVPTGRVPFEEVIRFLIHDLGVEPRSREWAPTLAESERSFYTRFMVHEDYPDY